MYLNKARKNLAAPGKLLLRCSTTYIPVGDLDIDPPLIKELLNKSYGVPGYGYAPTGDRSTLFAIFPLYFVPFMQYAG